MTQTRPSLDSNETAALERAAAWRIRLTYGPASSAERQAFKAWLEQSSLNAAAMDVVDRSWSLSREAGAHLPRPVRRARASGTVQWVTSGTAAAGLVLAAVWFGTATSERFVTRPGEQRVVQLADGSEVFLDASTTLRSRTTLLGREAWLDSGRAEFEVVRNGRSFVARTERMSAEVLGTRFVLANRRPSDFVHLLEGSLRVRSEDGDEVLLRPGEQVGLTETGLQNGAVGSAEAASAWTRGRLEFDGVSLADALHAFALEPDTVLRINDRVADLQISGSFRSDDLEPFLRSVAEVHPVAWRRDRDVYVVEPR